MEEVLTAVQIGLLVTATIGATEMVKAAFDQNWRTVGVIAVAALVGVLGGVALAGLTALAAFAGLAVGLGAAGVVTTVKVAKSKS